MFTQSLQIIQKIKVNRHSLLEIDLGSIVILLMRDFRDYGIRAAPLEYLKINHIHQYTPLNLQ